MDHLKVYNSVAFSKFLTVVKKPPLLSSSRTFVHHLTKTPDPFSRHPQFPLLPPALGSHQLPVSVDLPCQDISSYNGITQHVTLGLVLHLALSPEGHAYCSMCQ